MGVASDATRSFPLPCSPAIGAIEGLKSLKQARITDPATGQTFGLVRIYADPGEPLAPAQELALTHKPARGARGGGHHPRGPSSKPVQVRSRGCHMGWHDCATVPRVRAARLWCRQLLCCKTPPTATPCRLPCLQSCFNCGTTSTPLWRKERETGRMYCNACGIFKKTHGVERPLGGCRGLAIEQQGLQLCGCGGTACNAACVRA